jgi:hypothetical protein
MTLFFSTDDFLATAATFGVRVPADFDGVLILSAFSKK